MQNPEAAATAEMTALMHAERARIRATLARDGLTPRDFEAPDGAKALRYIATVWAALLATAFAWQALPGATALALIPVIGVIQHAMLNIVHEASHDLLLRDRRRGGWVANLFAALPIAHTVASYRVTHRDHHSFLRSTRDPSAYVTLPELTRRDIRRTVLQLLGGRLVWELVARSVAGRRFRSEDTAARNDLRDTDRRRLLAVAAFHATSFGIAAGLGAVSFWVAWLVTVMTVTPTLDGLRTLVEHRSLPADGAFHTRSHHRSTLASGLMAPFFQYHWEHHLFPAIPHHGLARLHAHLLAADDVGAQPAAGGFFGTLRQVL